MEYVFRQEEAAAGCGSFVGQGGSVVQQGKFCLAIKTFLATHKSEWSYYSDAVGLLLLMAKICQVIWNTNQLCIVFVCLKYVSSV